MGLRIEWVKREPPDETIDHDRALEVDEQHGLPVTIYFRDTENTEATEVTTNDGLPVRIVPHQRRSIILPQVAPSTTVPTLIAPANALRTSIMITNTTGSQVVWLSFDRNTLATNGQYLHSAAGSNITLFGQQEIWGLSVTGAQTLSVMEEIEGAVL